MLKLVTFGGGSTIWARALRRLEAEALQSGAFSSVNAYTPMDLRAEIPDFWSEHRGFLEANSRGFGYWIWKPAIVAKALSSLSPSETGVVYLDAGCSLNLNNLTSRNRLHFYEEMTIQNGGVFFQLGDGNTHARYTKRQTLAALNGERFLDSNLFAATAFFVNRRSEQVDFVNEWLRNLLQDEYSLVKDSAPSDTESQEFVEHRHDQSILSLMLERASFSKLGDETYFSPNWKEDGKSYPIWATRNKSGYRFKGEGLYGKVSRFLEKTMVSLRD